MTDSIDCQVFLKAITNFPFWTKFKYYPHTYVILEENYTVFQISFTVKSLT